LRLFFEEFLVAGLVGLHRSQLLGFVGDRLVIGVGGIGDPEEFAAEGTGRDDQGSLLVFAAAEIGGEAGFRGLLEFAELEGVEALGESLVIELVQFSLDFGGFGFGILGAFGLVEFAAENEVAAVLAEIQGVFRDDLGEDADTDFAAALAGGGGRDWVFLRESSP
jgi:hypothetical protein